MSNPARFSFARRGALALLAAGGGLAWLGAQSRAQDPLLLPPPAQDDASVGNGTRTAVLAGGCFWGVQGVYQHVTGVLNAVSGYAGGDLMQANYELVSTGRTRHAEAVQITFDPAKVTFGTLLQIYFSVAHDPTQLNRQGPDIGPQYRSTIFPADAVQAELAAAYIRQLDAAKAFRAPIATTIEPGKPFFPAEAYHQDYMTRNPRQPYIVTHDLPKLEALKTIFPERYRAEPVLVATTKSTG